MTDRDPLYVTSATLPPIGQLLPLLDQIWHSRRLSNFGPIHRQLEAALSRHLGIEHLTLVANATLGLILSLRHLGAKSEIITTPFSFVASAHAIRWAGATPVFADIDPTTLNLDPSSVEQVITSETRCILAVHCFGIPCNVAGLKAVAERHGLSLVYDAAHAFGVNESGTSVLHHGDLSVLSFHATKVFNTAEGGAIVSRNRETKLALERLCNFGIADETSIFDIGLNAKLSELHAALGLALLPQIDAAIAARSIVARRYWDQLVGVEGIRCLCSPSEPGRNHYAFPIIVEASYPVTRDALYARLQRQYIYARRYFYPLISDLPIYSKLPTARPMQLPIARDAAARILCLPMYPDLSPVDQQRIIDIIRAP